MKLDDERVDETVYGSVDGPARQWHDVESVPSRKDSDMPTARISEAGQALVNKLAKETGQTHAEVIDRALRLYQRELFLDAVNEGYASLRAETPGWAEEETDRELWDNTLLDGLE
jgi:hypothetical protein